MSSPDEHRQILISTDGHCGADLWGYKPYLEQRYHDQFDAWAHAFRDPWVEEVDLEYDANHRGGYASMLAPLNWDSRARLEYLDGQGIAAEVLFPNTAPPFYPSGVLTAPGPRSREEYEFRSAGLRAHNRWLADFCSDAPERRAGFAQIFLDDVDDAIAEVRWAKNAGLRGVLVPGDHVLQLVNLYYPRFDPLWAVCEELDLPVHRHAAFPTESVHDGGDASELVSFVEIEFYTVRAIAHMILAGVFERHQKLRFVITEMSRAGAIAGYLTGLDELMKLGLGVGTPMHEHIRGAVTALQRLPSEYFAGNCFLAGPHDLRAGYNAGVPNLMWGADVPHSEGTAPYTTEALRAELADLPEFDIDTLLATRAADVYDFDLGALQAIADRIGPTIREIKTPLPAEERPTFPQETFCTVFLDRHAAPVDSRAG